MKIIDTHAHLCDSSFDEDLETVLDRAAEAGVCTVVAVSEDLSDARKNLKLSETYPMIRPAAGLYPDNPDQRQAEEMVAWIRENRTRLWAIGEVGLDYWIAKAPEDRELQANIFSMFVDLSLELDLPLNVHSRSAGRHVIDILLSRGAKRVQLHAFDGKFGTALRSSYSGSKHALHGFFESLRAEHYEDDIRVTLICPGFVNTDVSVNALTADGSRQGTKDKATAQGLSPEDFARKAQRAISRQKREVVIGGWLEVLAVYVKRFFPGLHARMIRKAAVT